MLDCPTARYRKQLTIELRLIDTRSSFVFSVIARLQSTRNDRGADQGDNRSNGGNYRKLWFKRTEQVHNISDQEIAPDQ